MNVYLIRTDGVEDALYFGVCDFLQHIPGPFTFHTHGHPAELSIQDEVKLLFPDDEKYHRQEVMESRVMYSAEMSVERLSWKDLFHANNDFRKKSGIPEEDIVILLTDYGNYPNWFSGYDEETPNNYFVHTEQWELYAAGDNRYPIAYQIVSILLKQIMFDKPSEMFTAMHKTARGCILDFCEQKEEISFKLRTADICPDCQKIIADRKVSHVHIRYTFEMMDSIRRQLLFRERYDLLRNPLTLLLKGRNKSPYIPDLGMLKINLTPAELGVYLLFLNHPEGIKVSDVVDHRTELSEYMHLLSRRDDRAVIEKLVEDLCRADSNSLSEKMAKIRAKFVKLLGADLAQSYIISGPNGGEKKIVIDRELVKYEE